VKKVLIRGTYGRDEFESHFNHLISDFKLTEEVSLIKSSLLETHSLDESILASFDLVVLTTLGKKDINKYADLDEAIDEYLSILDKLNKNCKVLIDSNDNYFSEISKKFKKYSDIDIISFGKKQNNTYIIFEKKDEFSNEIVAKIEHKIVAYNTPISKEFSADDTLGIILCAYYLNLDIHSLVDKYHSFGFKNKINTMENKNSSLKGLRTLEPSDIGVFKKYTILENKKSVLYYFPYLYFFTQEKNKELLIYESTQSISLFLLDKFNSSTPPRMRLFIPTLPLLEKDQLDAFNRIYKYHSKDELEILWVEQSDIGKLDKIDKNLMFKYKTSEFIYSPKLFNNLAGGKFRTLRQQLKWFSNYENVEVVPYEKKYFSQCLKLYELWKNTQEDRYEKIVDEDYLKQTLQNSYLFNHEDIEGIVLLDQEKVIAFGFFGKLSEEVCVLYLAKCDYSYKGIQMYLKYKMIRMSESFTFANDGGARISKGLNFSKKKFNPVMYNNVYSAHSVI